MSRPGQMHLNAFRPVFPRDYTGRTLREHYGVPRPLNMHVREATQAT